MLRRLQKAMLLSLLLAFAAPASAVDPIVMFLLGIAREMAFNAIRERVMAPGDPEPPPAVYPGTTVEPAQVRRLIDQGYDYLSRSRRDEVFESLHASLMDPKNAAVSASTIEYLAEHAAAMRAFREELARMSLNEKSRIAAEFREQAAALSPDEKDKLAELIRQQVLPVPRDLNDMLLAEIGG